MAYSPYSPHSIEFTIKEGKLAEASCDELGDTQPHEPQCLAEIFKGRYFKGTNYSPC
jgi:hypothetical protein